MSVYVDLAGCTKAIDVVYRVEAALCQAGERDAAVCYAAQMREIHPHTPETAALYAPPCVVYRQEDAEPVAAEGA